MVRGFGFVASALMAAALSIAAARGEIPMPPDALAVAESTPPAGPMGALIGVWAHDAWQESHPAAVAIASDDGVKARVVHAYDRDHWRPLVASHHTDVGRLDGDALVVRFSSHVAVRYSPLPDGRLFGRMERRGEWHDVRYVIFDRLPVDLQTRKAELARTDARPWHMVDIPMTDPDSGRPITLKATYYPPATAGRAPLLLMNHGDVTPGHEGLVLQQGELARLFVSRGWAVLEMMRRGAGGSGGTLLPEIPRNGLPTAAYGDRRMAADFADVDAALAAARTWATVDPARILLGGFSRGGMVALEYLAAHPDAAIGALNFSGSIWGEDIERDKVRKRYTGDRLARAGTGIRKPTLWLYGDNDSYQSVPIIRQRFDGYRAAGGTGELRIYSGVPHEGHDLINRPAFWEDGVLAFLRRLSP